MIAVHYRLCPAPFYLLAGVIEFALIGTVCEEMMHYAEADSEADEEDVDFPFAEVLKRRRCS